MQGTKTRENLKTFDRYDCLTCETTVLAPPPKDGENRSGRAGGGS